VNVEPEGSLLETVAVAATLVVFAAAWAPAVPGAAAWGVCRLARYAGDSIARIASTQVRRRRLAVHRVVFLPARRPPPELPGSVAV
jgi:hypothetical protein